MGIHGPGKGRTCPVPAWRGLTVFFPSLLLDDLGEKLVNTSARSLKAKLLLLEGFAGPFPLLGCRSLHPLPPDPRAWYWVAD